MRINTPRILLVGKCLVASPGLRSFFEGLGVHLHFSESLAGAASLLRLRRFDVVLSQTQLPEGSACRLLSNLLASSASFILSFPVESTYLWIPAIWNGQHCWGTWMLHPAEFGAKLRELLGQRHLADSRPRRAPAKNAGRTTVISSAAGNCRASFVGSLSQKTRGVNSSAHVGEDDAALVAAAKSGSNQAFEILVGRYRTRILRVVLRFTRNQEDAEDIVQESLQKAFLHLQRFQGSSAFSTWLTRIAINEALMWLRRRRASREVSIEEPRTDDETAPPLEFPDPGPCPEESCLQRVRKRVLFRAMNELTPAMRAAVELRELDELSTKETARALGLSVQAVKSRLFHGRTRLRARLKSYVGSTRTYGRQALRPSDEANDIPHQELVSSECD